MTQPEHSKTYGMKIFFTGILLTTIGGSFLFIKDVILNNTLHDAVAKIGYVIAIAGFIIAGIGMFWHWVEFFRRIKEKKNR